MDNKFISRPKDFHYMEGSEAINFRKTFDLNGTQNDEMLRLYLRKAGLSDEIECLTVEQRRAFIYDIIKSNKMPGYWLPSTMQSSSYNTQRPKIQPPPVPTYSVTSSPKEEHKNSVGNPMINYGTMRSSVSMGSLQNVGKNSPILSQRFVPAPATPPAPSTYVTNSKGIQFEISGPMNFQHTSGDMIRDMTRNAFDLNPSSNDNVLRKYMMERGISEEDITGMRKTDLIRKIVQSKFTWLPKKNKNYATNNSSTINQRINYATISGYPDNTKSATPVRPAPNFQPPTPPSPPPKTDFSNFTLVTSRFADSTRFPAVDETYAASPKHDSNVGVIPLPPLPPGTQLPAPPPRKSQYSSASLPTIKRNAPPPPLVIAAQANNFNTIYQTRDLGDYDNNYGIYPMNMAPRNSNEPTYALVQDHQKTKNRKTPPPTSPKPYLGNIPPPPLIANRKNIPPPPPMGAIESNTLPQQKVATRKIPPNPPIIATGNIPPPPPMTAMANIPPPPPMAGLSSIPPPPPPMMSPKNGSQLAASKNLESVNANGSASTIGLGTIPSAAALNPTTTKSSIVNNSEDPRDAFLESIRKGVTLKKIDQKSATISGVKPRAERRPQITDFLTELKMGVTSRRMKDSNDNPFRSDESNEWDD